MRSYSHYVTNIYPTLCQFTGRIQFESTITDENNNTTVDRHTHDTANQAHTYVQKRITMLHAAWLELKELETKESETNETI